MTPLAVGDSISVEEIGWPSRGIFRRRRREIRYSAEFVSQVRGLFPGSRFPLRVVTPDGSTTRD